MKRTEELLSKNLSRDILIEYLDQHPEEYEEAVRIAQTSHLPQCWRACWVLFHITSKDDERLKPHLSELIMSIKGKTGGHQRELIKLISKMSLDEDQEGMMFDRCMTIWESVKMIPSVRMMAFKFLMKVVNKYPELKMELRHITQDHYLESLTPGVRRSIDKQLDGFK
ncbi:hypothetical protein [Marinoscillum pacificum]|uniref:hypothetical protein n=1 Tax=Marinoscillum pacificum TaxID=392723 RepID=UPI0021574CE5|nr:hypothetical protein [Marinoscillum pacificum]